MEQKGSFRSLLLIAPILIFLLAAEIIYARQTHRTPSPKLNFTASIVNGYLKVRWVNEGDTFLVTIGSIIGWAGVNPRLQFRISGRSANGELENQSVPGFIEGRTEPLVVCLPTGSEYGFWIPTDKLYLPKHSGTLKDIDDKPWKLLVSFVGERPSQMLPNHTIEHYQVLRAYPVNFPFWTGRIEYELDNPPK